MRLIAYPTVASPPCIRAAQPRRAWMDATSERFVYRCLPLTIANQHGWEILCGASVELLWNGGRGTSSITIVPLDGAREGLPETHFGEGVVTFHPGYLFRTDPSYNLYVGGPPNARKDGIVPLTGIVETDWLPFTFTMNWAFTRPGVPVRFEAGEPFCQVFPVPRGLVESVEPEYRARSGEPELAEAYAAWSASRTAFNRDLRVPGTDAADERWQRFYVRGTTAEGGPRQGNHQTRLAVREFGPLPPSLVHATPATAATDAPVTNTGGGVPVTATAVTDGT